MPETFTAHAGADLLFAGDVFCDLVFAGAALPEVGGEVFAQQFTMSPGGVATRAVAGARSGASALLLGRVGDDPLGAHLLKVLSAEPGLDARLLQCVPGRQTAVSVALTGAHDRTFISYQEALGHLSVPADLGPVGAVHVPVSQELPEWVRLLRRAGTTIVGGVGWDEQGHWSSLVLDRLEHIDVFVPNAIEAMNYTRTESPLAAARALAERVPLVIVTKGADGLLAIDSGTGQVVHVPPVPVPAVDPTGAGDVFVATFMGSARHGWDLPTRLRFANLNAAASVTVLGGAVSAPHAGALPGFVSGHDIPGDWSFLTTLITPAPRTNGNTMNHFRRPLVIGVGATLTVALAACAPGSSSSETETQSVGSVSKDFGSEPITLTVWDQNNDGTYNQVQEDLNEQFEEKYPNVTINRVVESFADLKTTLKLALSGNDAPDVVQANQGYSDMGAFVKAGLLRPVDDYADLYGWKNYFPSSMLKLNSFSEDGNTWQGDKLYGVSQTGSAVGVYYNQAVLEKAGVSQAPKTLDELTAAMGKVKESGTLPLSYGNLTKSPGIHLYGFLLTTMAGADNVRDLTASKSGTWTSPEAVAAAQTIRDWEKQGYLTPDSSGVSGDDAAAVFGAGKSAFFISGSWWQGTLQSTPAADDMRFTALSADASAAPSTMGGQGLAWAMTSKTANADAAAAYVDFVSGQTSASAMMKAGNLPTVVPEADVPAEGTLAGDVAGQYRSISAANGLAPFLDYSTPTFYDTITAAVQDLIGGKLSPQKYTETLEADYTEFKSGRS